MRFMTAGESHGTKLAGIIDGFPAGVPIDKEIIAGLLQRRRKASGRSARMEKEGDHVEYLSGITAGTTTGMPIAFTIENNPLFQDAGMQDRWSKQAEPITVPRPGHVDLPGVARYGNEDCRVAAERASARETAVRTAVGGFALQLLGHLGMQVTSCQLTAAGEANIDEVISAARHDGDTVGGTVSVVMEGLPGGIGCCYGEGRLDSRLAAAIMALPAVKAVSLGPGLTTADSLGSRYTDKYTRDNGMWRRGSNNAGGIEGGITNGEPVALTFAVKPVPTRGGTESFDFTTGLPATAPVPRHDICAAAAAAVVAESVMGWVIADALVCQLNGTSLETLTRELDNMRKRWEALTSC